MSVLNPEFFSKPIAHRGLHDKSKGIIENSMSAINAAIEHGYGIEIDVQPANDLTPMVFHDYFLDRLTKEKGPIKSRSVKELESIKLTGSIETIPTLHSVLRLIRGRVPLLVEIKDQDMRLGPNIGLFHEKVCEALHEYGPVAIMSFSPATIAGVKNAVDDLPCGLVTDPFEAEDWPNIPQARREELAGIPDAEPLKIDFISHQQKDLTSPVVANLKSKGLPVFCWTIRNAEDEARALEIADNVTFEGYTPARRG